MNQRKILVSMEPRQGAYVAFADLDSVLADQRGDLERLLGRASSLYSESVSALSQMVSERNTLRVQRRPVPARLVWRIGRAVWALQEVLGEIGLELDGVYDHLSRDIGVKRKSLEKAVIFGRYIPHESAIPESLRWGKCEHGTRQIALQICRGSIEDSRDDQG